MSGRAEKERQKLIQEKCQAILTQLLRDDDNKYCVDCDAKGPRWASWNLGIFLCIRCAGIHRNLGVHISRVKSINLDSWTAEQVAHLQAMGNSKARAVYEANLPDNFRRPTNDSALEAFIRAKYETKKYIAKEWVQPPPPPPAFDIDEEIRKEKEKRRQKANKTPTIPSLGDVQHNPLPRPQGAPAGTQINAERVPQSVSSSKRTDDKENEKATAKASADPLGLGLGAEEDLFEAFVSAKPESSSPSKVQQDTNPTTQTSNLKSDKDEEAEFFNQKLPEEKKPLSKESILSLYGSAPPQPAVTPTAAPFANQFAGLGNGVSTLFPTSTAPTTTTSPFAGLTDSLFASSGNSINSINPINPALNQPTMSQATMPATNPFINAFTNNNINQLQQQMVSMQLNPTPAAPAPSSWATPAFGNVPAFPTETANQGNPFLIPGMQQPAINPTRVNPLIGVNSNPVTTQFNTDANLWQ